MTMFWWTGLKDVWQRTWDGLVGLWGFVVLHLANLAAPGFTDLSRTLDDD